MRSGGNQDERQSLLADDGKGDLHQKRQTYDSSKTRGMKNPAGGSYQARKSSDPEAVINSASNSMTECRSSGARNFLERVQTIPGFVITRNILLCLLNILAMSGVLVTLPQVAGGFSDPDVKSDAYVALLIVAMWFPVIYLIQLVFIKIFIDRTTPIRPTVPWSYMVISGCTLGVGIALTSFVAIPSRTPPYLQAILQTLSVPFTVLVRLVIVGKGNTKQYV